MTVSIVTDSLSDITDDLAQELGVTVVPLTVFFGHESFLDRVTITTEEFYRRLVRGDVWPTTTQPTPADFVAVYQRLAKEADEILVITLSSKLSGTYQSAKQAESMFEGKCRIEVIDSEKVAMSLGVIVITAAKAAKEGAGLDELADLVRQSIRRSHLVAYFDTLKYLAKGGRIGRAQGLLGAMLSVKPILTIKDGEMSPLTRLRSRAAGMDYLCNYAAGFAQIDELAVEYATTPEDAAALVERLRPIYPGRIYTAALSPVVGTYAGPNALALSILGTEKA